MIYKHPYGVSPTLSATIDGAVVAYDTLREVEIHLESNLHDMAILHMNSIPTRATKDYRNRSVQIVLDNGGNYVHEFAGYVVDVRPVSITKDGVVNGSPFQDAQLICLGVSYTMRGNRSHVWNGYRLQDVVEEFARVYGVSADVPADALVSSVIVQDNESDWQFLVRYAKLLGYSVTMHGTHLHVFDPHKAAGRHISYHKLRSGRDVGATIAPHPGNISTFKASLQDPGREETIVTVNQPDGQVYDVTLADLRSDRVPGRPDRIPTVADTFEQAVRAIKSHARESYDFTAEAEVLGVAGCVPGGLVNVDSYGSEVDGLWFVDSVVHRLNSGIFVSQLGLKRNLESELEVETHVAAFRTPPAPRVVNGKWTSSRRVVNVY